ncbi:hypothetical protein Ancab_013491 [Ancistrocladus abbreviatus]
MRASFRDVLLTFLIATVAGASNGVALVIDIQITLSLSSYLLSCPSAENVVKNITQTQVAQSPPLAAQLLRLHFHDCFVRGCDGSVLIDSTPGNTAEKDALPNLTLRGFKVIDQIKATLEQTCPGIVSCADILALAARDAVSYQYGRDLWTVLTGRQDGRISIAQEALANLPSPFSNFTTLEKNFADKGLSVTDLVTLSGGHTIGISHCAPVVPRLYNFDGNGGTDPSLDPTYAAYLKTICPPIPDPATVLGMDPNSTLSFDGHYYNIVEQNMGLFESDAALLNNTESALLVDQFKNLQVFLANFKISAKKMSEIQSGNAGEIRKNCSVINPN